MNNEIEDWAKNNFCESSSVGFSFKDIEYYDLRIFVDELSLDGSGWSQEELHIEGVKSYDEEGDSSYIGVLVLDSRSKTAKDFLNLAPYFDELLMSRIRFV